MAISRLNTPISVDRYLAIRGKIVSRREGLARDFISENYVIKDGEFIEKNRLDTILSQRKAPLGVGSKEPSEDKEAFLDYLSSNLGFIQEHTQTFVGTELEPTRFSPIQAFLMNNRNPFLWAVKSRQFGFSYVLAAKALAKAMLKPKHTSIFTSYNEEESKEKITYARELYDSMPSKWRMARKLKYDNKTSLVYEKAGPGSSETRILSYPQRIIRGKGGEIDIAFDEAAHCIHIRKIYTSAMPALSRGSNSSLWIGSSPAGKGGLFYEIGINQDNEYAPYLRLTIPWWVVPEFSTDVKTATAEAWDMHTDERIARFATDRLKMIRKTMPLDDFRQEYECEYLDEAYSYFPWDLINSCVPIFNVDAQGTPDFDAPGADLSSNDKAKSGVGIDHYTDFDEFLFAIKSGILKGPFLGGFDVGRTTDASEIYYIEEDPKSNQQICRCNIQLKNVPFPEQRAIVLEQFRKLGNNLLKFGVDYNGIGMNIAEDLETEAYDMVAKLNFNNNAWKEQACRRFKIRLEKNLITLPTNREVLNQIHSIKRILLPGGLWRFDAESNAKHHGDKFWALIGASEVGFPADDSEQPYNNFGNKIETDEKKKTKRVIGGSTIFSPDRINSIMKYNPWGATMPMMPGIQRAPIPKIPSLISSSIPMITGPRN